MSKDDDTKLTQEDDTKLTQEEMDVVIYDARVGDLETLKEIFDEIDPKLLLTIQDDITKSTTIHMASANGHLEIIKYLLSILSKEDAKKLISIKNETGNTPLHWASYNGHLEIVKLLVEEYDADPFEKNNVDHDSIFEAENNNKIEVENWFLTKYTPEQDFKIESDDEKTKITYQPGKESKLADEQARDAVFKSKLDDNNDTKDNELELKTKNLSINENNNNI